jgi:FtsH-binding integral membrane protein
MAMESPRGGMLGRVLEKVLTLIALALVVLAGVAIYRMAPQTRQAIWAGIWRTVAWFVLAAGLPWVGKLFIGRLLEIGSNWAGVVLLSVLTLVDAMVGLILMRGWPSGGWSWLAALAALAVAGLYNYLVAEYLAEKAGG